MVCHFTGTFWFCCISHTILSYTRHLFLFQDSDDENEGEGESLQEEDTEENDECSESF